MGWGPACLHRHFAVPHRRAGGEAFGCIDDGVGIHAVVAVEVVDGAGLAELLDAERLDAMPAHAAEPAECGGMTIDHGDDAAVARQRRQQSFDMAEMWQAAMVATHPAAFETSESPLCHAMTAPYALAPNGVMRQAMHEAFAGAPRKALHCIVV